MNKNKVDAKPFDTTRSPTKVEVLRTVMKVFDPRGMLSFFIVRAKVLMKRSLLSGTKNTTRVVPKQKNSLNEETISFIETLYSAGVRGPKKMTSCLIRQKREGKIHFDEVPKLHQIKYFLANTRDKSVGPAVLSLGELERWRIDNTTCPTDDIQPFVIGYTARYGDSGFDEDGEKSFWYLVSSENLLNLTSQSNVVCADATYKILKGGFPVPLFGTVVADKHFKAPFIGVSSNETRSTYREMFAVSIFYFFVFCCCCC